MRRLVDCHCHLLPGVDDGSDSAVNTYIALMELSRQGFGHVILTPHDGRDGWWFADPDKVKQVWAEMSKLSLPVKVYLWAETNCLYMDEVLGRAMDGTLSTLGPNRTVLLEYEAEEFLDDILHHALQIRALGYEPILAHPERLKAFQLNPVKGFSALKNHDIGVQINAYSLGAERKECTRTAARTALEHQVVKLIGSDSHPPKRWPDMSPGVRVIKQMCERDYALDILWRNAYKMLGLKITT